jgi:hypothetical protein
MNKITLASALLASATVLVAASAHAAPLSVMWTNDTTTYPSSDFNPAPNTQTGTGTWAITSGTIGGTQSSPWVASSTPLALFSCVDCSPTPPGTGSETVTYNNLAGTSTFSILWGTPDAYNTLTLTGANGNTFSLTGAQLAASAGIAPSSGFDWVTFTVTGTTFSSAALFDDGTAAFEYADVTFTPLPAALPLFAGGLGMIGLLGRRRKRQGATALPA